MIRDVMGHSSVKSTERYSRARDASVEGVRKIMSTVDTYDGMAQVSSYPQAKKPASRVSDSPAMISMERDTRVELATSTLASEGETLARE